VEGFLGAVVEKCECAVLYLDVEGKGPQTQLGNLQRVKAGRLRDVEIAEARVFNGEVSMNYYSMV